MSIACSLKALAHVTIFCLAYNNSFASAVLVAPVRMNGNISRDCSYIFNIINIVRKLENDTWQILFHLPYMWYRFWHVVFIIYMYLNSESCNLFHDCEKKITNTLSQLYQNHIFLMFKCIAMSSILKWSDHDVIDLTADMHRKRELDLRYSKSKMQRCYGKV